MLQQNREDTNRLQAGAVGQTDPRGPSTGLPRFPIAAALDDTTSKTALGLLRRFHLGDPTAAYLCDQPDETHLPALLNAYRHVRRLRYEYPVILTPADSVEGERYFSPLDEFLQDSVRSLAPGEGAARILKDNLAWLEYWLRDRMTGEALPQPAAAMFQAGAAALLEHLNLSVSNQQALAGDLDKLQARLVPGSLILALGPNTPFYLLHHVMRCERVAAIAAFRARLAASVAGLTRLLAVERAKASAAKADLVTGMGEGGRYLNPAGFAGVVAHRHEGSVAMSAERHGRIMNALTVLQTFSDDEAEMIHLVMRPGSVVIEEGNIFRIESSDDPCRTATRRYDDLARAFSGAFAALRIAELELEDRYDPDIHDSWFENFDWEAFSDEELRLVPTVVAVETTDHAAGDYMASVSRLLNAGKPVQVVMTVSAHGSPERAGKDMFRGFRTELAWFGIGHREAVVNQLSISRTGSLVTGFSAALASARPGLHLIHTGFTPSQPLHPWIMASAALESRAHPHIRFNRALIDDGGIEIADNPSLDADWAINEFCCEDDQAQPVSLPLAFTFADYCLLKPDLRREFRLVPSGLASDSLVTVDSYLASDDATRRSVIPYLWSVDAEGQVQRLVISRALALACRDRLHFWRDLQSRAGVHNYHVDLAVEKTRAEEQATAAATREALLQAHAEELDGVQAAAAEEIMGRLTEVLLGLDLSNAAIGSNLRTDVPHSPPPPAVAEVAESADDLVGAPPPALEQAAEEEEDAISFNEPWTDTMLCTSCDDCMAINKAMFVYNEDKQMVLSNPRAGTYEQLVKAAELCPARCIHPGKPLNPDEPGIEALMKRAEPYN